MRKIKIIKRIIKYIISIFLVLIAIELFLNFFLPQGNPLWGYDPVIGIKLMPNKCSRHISSEYNTKFCSNAEGFRDADHAVLKEDSVTRIAIFGDSFVIAREVEEKERFTNLIGNSIEQKCGKKIEIMNFGIAGQGTAGQLLTFNHFAKKYNPDYTILIMAEDDIADNYLPLEDRNYVPTYKLNQAGELEYVSFKKAPIISNPILRSSQKIFSNIFSLAGKNFRVFSRLLKGREGGLPKYIHVYSPNDSEDFQIAWDIERRLLIKFKKEVESIGSEFIVIWMFSENQVTNFQDYSDAQIVQSFDVTKPSTRVGGILKELNIAYIDLFNNIYPNLNNIKSKDLFFKYSNHFNKKGHQFIANLIVSDLLNETKICEK